MPKILISNTLLIFVLLAFILAGCKSDGKSGKNSVDLSDLDLDESGKIVAAHDTIGEGLPIFYNMYLSVEMSSLFETSGTVYNSDIVTPPGNVSDYITSSDQAIILGVYAVDLSYARVLNQLEVAGQYFNSMKKLSEEMGIPNEFFYNSAERFERNMNDKDSLIIIANEVYMKTDSYLRENERYSAAALIILGGWVEAVYIACNIAEESNDIDIIERLAEQKFSLYNLMDMLTVNADDEVVKHFLDILKPLKENFDKFVVDVEPEFDATSNKGKQQIQEYMKTVEKIRVSVSSIRKEMIS
ncbi:MAG: hypothetical protein JXJ22_07825 [Bacteroidales bacterium]|nr:hypothetical protein [Bacteroidales bacterium]